MGSLADGLRVLREAYGLDQIQIARRAAAKDPTIDDPRKFSDYISKLERSEDPINPSWDTLVRLSDGFDLSLSEFVRQLQLAQAHPDSFALPSSGGSPTVLHPPTVGTHAQLGVESRFDPDPSADAALLEQLGLACVRAAAIIRGDVPLRPPHGRATEDRHGGPPPGRSDHEDLRRLK
jgi:transcriptional regulator with XRE-family HTH domain